MIVHPALVATALVMTVSLGFQSSPGRAECLPARDLPQKSFARIDGLGLKFAFVWVDDIQSRFVGGYDPFDVFVVTGKIYSPFEMATGKLERGAFDRLTKPGRNIDRFGPVSVPTTFPKGQPPTLRFATASGKYQVRLMAVKPARFGGDDVMTFQVCRE
jgi:hypothetical protein